MSQLDLIELINIEFEERRIKNKFYSLRALSRDLGIQPATLSHILKRKRAISKGNRAKIYNFLNLTNEQIKILNESEKSEISFTELDLDILKALGNWYYDAILELVRTKGIKFKPKFIADRLGISEIEAEGAIERLKNLSFIKENPNKSWTITFDNNLMYGNDNTNFALQSLQRQLLEKAIEALMIVPKIEREQASMTMAINKKDLPEAKKRIKEFHQDLCKYLQRKNRDADEVFQLITSFFPLSK
jgi:uncharacterized protein (TIGR02147 family)